jgi:hypothetical protein
MGSNSIFGVIALMVFFGLINSSLNERDRRAGEDTYGYIEYSTAREIARSGINIALKKVADSSSVTNVVGSLDGGSYNVSLTRISDTLNIISTARFSDTTYKIKTQLRVYTKPFPGSFGAAVGLDVQNVNFSIGTNGNKILIDGNNYDTSGQTKVGSGNVAGVEVLTKTDSVAVWAYNKQIDGAPDVGVNSNLNNPLAYVDEYIADADYHLTLTSPLNNSTKLDFGSYNNPKIVYLDAGSDSNNVMSIKGNITGWGILVLHGSVAFGGTITWKGLVIVYDETHLDFSASTGNPTFIGALLMGGPPGSKFTTTGSALFRYSSQTLNTSKNIGKLLAYHILDWYE